MGLIGDFANLFRFQERKREKQLQQAETLALFGEAARATNPNPPTLGEQLAEPGPLGIPVGILAGGTVLVAIALLKD